MIDDDPRHIGMTFNNRAAEYIAELEATIKELRKAHAANVEQYEHNHATWPMQCAAAMCDNSRRALRNFGAA